MEPPFRGLLNLQLYTLEYAAQKQNKAFLKYFNLLMLQLLFLFKELEAEEKLQQKKSNFK